ncbi:MAG: hypothetical protein WC356_04795 [Candidatus Micrarchaeia archaeon]|jgi:hypothetical protein
MIKDALQWIKNQAPVQNLTFGGRQYTDQTIVPVKDPSPEPLYLHTLTGIKDYYGSMGNGGYDDIDGEATSLHVVSHAEVRLIGALYGGFQQRDTFLIAKLPETRGYPFGQWQDPETFIISLQAMFVQDEASAALLRFVTSIKEEDGRTSQDDGISQAVTVKKGVTLVAEEKVPNPVILRPYRTFLEVEQPAISCVLRLRSGPQLSLHEADGGQWRLEAIQNIKDYLVAAMAELGQKVPVIA